MTVAMKNVHHLHRQRRKMMVPTAGIVVVRIRSWRNSHRFFNGGEMRSNVNDERRPQINFQELPNSAMALGGWHGRMQNADARCRMDLVLDMV